MPDATMDDFRKHHKKRMGAKRTADQAKANAARRKKVAKKKVAKKKPIPGARLLEVMTRKP